jgi:hypothetical protein
VLLRHATKSGTEAPLTYIVLSLSAMPDSLDQLAYMTWRKPFHRSMTTGHKACLTRVVFYDWVVVESETSQLRDGI